MSNPNPGSKEAQALGCTCEIYKDQIWHHLECPVHYPELKTYFDLKPHVRKYQQPMSNLRKQEWQKIRVRIKELIGEENRDTQFDAGRIASIVQDYVEATVQERLQEFSQNIKRLNHEWVTSIEYQVKNENIEQLCDSLLTQNK